MKLCVIDCGAGNLHSVASGFKRAAAGMEVAVQVTTDPADLDHADRIVLPGVGAFADCMGGFRALPGMHAALRRRVLDDKTPFLGICVGMQMLLEKSHEHGVHEGLGWFKGEVVRFANGHPPPTLPLQAGGGVSGLRVPHMGWNELALRQPGHPLFAGMSNGEEVYFVHSYHAVLADPSEALAVTEYGGEVVAAIGREHLCGVQFHPEKSQKSGEKLLRNFLMMDTR